MASPDFSDRGLGSFLETPQSQTPSGLPVRFARTILIITIATGAHPNAHKRMTILRRSFLLWYACLAIGAFGADSPTDTEGPKNAFLDYWSALKINDVDRVVARLHVDFIANTKKQILSFLRGIPVDSQEKICGLIFGVGSVAKVEAMEPKKFMSLAFHHEPMRRILTSVLDARFEAETITVGKVDQNHCSLSVPFKLTAAKGEIAGALKPHLIWSEELGWQIAAFDPPEKTAN